MLWPAKTFLLTVFFAAGLSRAVAQSEVQPSFPVVASSIGSPGVILPITNSVNLDQYRTDVNSATDFVALRALRNKIAADIDASKNEIWEVDRRLAYLGDLTFLESNLNNAKLDLKCAQNKPECNRPVPETDTIINYISTIERNIMLVQERDSKLPDARRILSELERLYDELDRRINDVLNRDIVTQKFKSDVSLYFTAIVAVMIVLFFSLLFYDEKVRTSIFSTPSAIQFITLFSLVIAIILFGITGILEGKELSALLGGLSGYILGRYAADNEGKR